MGRFGEPTLSTPDNSGREKISNELLLALGEYTSTIAEIHGEVERDLSTARAADRLLPMRDITPSFIMALDAKRSEVSDEIAKVEKKLVGDEEDSVKTIVGSLAAAIKNGNSRAAYRLVGAFGALLDSQINFAELQLMLYTTFGISAQARLKFALQHGFFDDCDLASAEEAKIAFATRGYSVPTFNLYNMCRRAVSTAFSQ